MGHMEVYDAVVSLMRDLELLLSSYDRTFSSNWDPVLSKEEIENLYQNVTLMDSLLRDSSSSSYDSYNRFMADQLGCRILRIARDAGDYVDSHLSNVGFLGFGDRAVTLQRRFPCSSNYGGWEKLLPEFFTDVNIIDVQVKTVAGRSKLLECLRQRVGTGFATGILYMGGTHRPKIQDVKWAGGNATELESALHKLIDEPSKYSVREITGIDGTSSKTALARCLYEHPCVVSHFDVRIWITLSRQEPLKLLLERLYDSIGLCKRYIVPRSYSFRRFLRHRRCLIVVDDRSPEKVSNDLMKYLMIDSNSTRIILTSQDDHAYLDKNVRSIYHHDLAPTESWYLLQSLIFPNKSCPDELLLSGKEIAAKCRGFPLVILVVGRLLSNMDMTPTVWEQVSQRLDSFVVKVSLDTRNVQDLIYNHFLNHMEAFFYCMEVPPL